jgi:uncharacterized damage-inducible protein DinB
MTSADLLVDGFGRVREVVYEAVTGLTPQQLAYRPDPDANSIAWLVWHLTRIQDDHVSDVAKAEQIWTSRGWEERFGLPFAPHATGYGQISSEVAAVQVSSGDQLTGYYDAVHEQTIRYVTGLSDTDLARVVDERWDPPVTLAVRLVSVISDDLQHGGQAVYIRGMIQRGAD